MRRTRAGNSVPKSSQREKPRFIALLGVALLQTEGRALHQKMDDAFVAMVRNRTHISPRRASRAELRR